MKRYGSILMIAFTALSFLAGGCTDTGGIIDENMAVADHNWSYNDKAKFTFKIDDERAPFNLYMNLRVTAGYKYSNIFVLITQAGADKRPFTKRYELKLANKNGEWLGQGSGNLYSYQAPFLTNYKFPLKGTYQISIAQNMRDNPLREVSDVGLRVEKAAP